MTFIGDVDIAELSIKTALCVFLCYMSFVFGQQCVFVESINNIILK